MSPKPNKRSLQENARSQRKFMKTLPITACLHSAPAVVTTVVQMALRHLRGGAIKRNARRLAALSTHLKSQSSRANCGCKMTRVVLDLSLTLSQDKKR